MNVIGVVGFAGSGKGTVADILVEKYGFKKLAFADAVKDATSAIFGWERALLEGDTPESRTFREVVDPFWSKAFGFHITPRWALQKMGTEAGRDAFYPNIWISALGRKLKDDGNYVISDTRFPNEMEFIRGVGGSIIRVKRGPEPEWYETARAHNIDGVYEMYQKYPEVHVSEWAWIGSPFDAVITNDGSIDDLVMATHIIVDKLVEGV